MAIITETTINIATKIRIHNNWFLGFISFLIPPLIKSRVIVELEVITKEDNVLIDADTTSTKTNAIRMVGRVECSI